MSRNFKYTVEINFTSDKTKLFFSKNVPYPFTKSCSYEDKFEFYGNKIIIEAYRSKKVDFDEIFKNHQSALYKQIMKGLVYYYCTVGEPNKIECLNITLTKKDIVIDQFSKGISLNQIVKSNCDISILKKIDKQELECIFDETDKGYSLLIALSNLIKSRSVENMYDRFEKKWKCFNAIYRTVSGKNKDKEAQKFIRDEMVKSSDNFPLISKAVSKITVEEIEKYTRWRKFINNDFRIRGNISVFKNFIMRNEDIRLITIFKKNLSIRADALKANGLYEDVETYINTKFDEKITNNIHLSATLCIKYAYFVRNHSIHAEKIDSGFRLLSDSKEELEVIWLSGLLELLIIDWVNQYSKF